MTLAAEPVERMDLNEGNVRAELAEFLARTSTDGGVGSGPRRLLTGDHEGREQRVAEREGIDPDGGDGPVRSADASADDADAIRLEPRPPALAAAISIRA